MNTMSELLQIIGPQFSSFTRVVQLCCEELGLAYSLGTQWQGREYNLRSPELLGLNPFGKVPVLIHQGRALFESQAICRYLDNQFNQSRLQPGDAWQRAQTDQWCAAIGQYVDKVIVRDFLLELRFPKGENGAVRMDRVEAAIPAIIKMVSILERQLGEQDYLLGVDYSLADIQLAPIIHYLAQVPQNRDLLPMASPLRTYLTRLLQRPAAQKVLL